MDEMTAQDLAQTAWEEDQFEAQMRADADAQALERAWLWWNEADEDVRETYTLLYPNLTGDDLVDCAHADYLSGLA
jgi:hypothetical protein